MSATLILLLAVASTPAAAQEGDLCAVLPEDALSAAVPGSFDAPTGFSGTCQWHGTTESGASVDVMVYAVPGAPTGMPGAQVIDIEGHAAFSMSDPAMDVPTHVVGVETDPGLLLVLSITAADESLDLEAAANALASAALAAYEGGAVSASGSAAPAASAATEAGGVCGRATPDEIAAAIGFDVELSVQDLEVACSWEGEVDGQYVLVYAAQQEPGVFGAMLGSLDAVEVEGPGDEDWWVGSLASLFSRQGDVVFQVSYTSGATPSEDEIRRAVLAVMEAVLAP